LREFDKEERWCKASSNTLTVNERNKAAFGS